MLAHVRALPPEGDRLVPSRPNPEIPQNNRSLRWGDQALARMPFRLTVIRNRCAPIPDSSQASAQ
jgi:hypothetical protein